MFPDFDLQHEITAVSLNPIKSGGGDSEIKVYDQNDQLLDTIVTTSTEGGFTYIGIRATGSSLIKRIQITGNSNNGCDNIRMYSDGLKSPRRTSSAVDQIREEIFDEFILFLERVRINFYSSLILLSLSQEDEVDPLILDRSFLLSFFLDFDRFNSDESFV